uniref:Uncharacterized protein n=1 Tax=Cryptomonas curvata TaxID=233186 RepID=A0A7S0MNJ7_9CRYP
MQELLQGWSGTGIGLPILAVRNLSWMSIGLPSLQSTQLLTAQQHTLVIRRYGPDQFTSLGLPALTWTTDSSVWMCCKMLHLQEASMAVCMLCFGPEYKALWPETGPQV